MPPSKRWRRLTGTPIHAFLRREGYAAAEAQDLTQAFFARLLEKNYPAQADRAKGRFRSFLLLTLRHLLSDTREHATASNVAVGSSSCRSMKEVSEGRYRAEPADLDTPETLFERRWADTIRLAGPGNVLAKEPADAKEFAGLVRSGLARLVLEPVASATPIGGDITPDRPSTAKQFTRAGRCAGASAHVDHRPSLFVSSEQLSCVLFPEAVDAGVSRSRRNVDRVR